MTKQPPDLRIDRLGTHLFQVTRKNGSSFLKWDWDKLLEEVQAATADRKVQYVDAGDLTPEEATKLVKKVSKAVKAKTNLVKDTEAKVAKARAKKASAPAKAATKTKTTKKKSR